MTCIRFLESTIESFPVPADAADDTGRLVRFPGRHAAGVSVGKIIISGI
jgi:hypothetical protein